MEFRCSEFNIIIDLPNQRIKMTECPKSGLSVELINCIQQTEKSSSCTKTIIYAKKGECEFFSHHGFHLEGKLDGFFKGQNAYIMVRYSDKNRALSKTQKENEKIMNIVLQDSKKVNPFQVLPQEMVLRAADSSDAVNLAALYRKVFKSYPTPMYDPLYVDKAMKSDTHIMIIEYKQKILCAASAEVDSERGSAELTDCATHPDFRGQSLLSYLFVILEQWLEDRGVYYLYSLTRSMSPGMNLTTHRHGYQYRGTLINNCDIYSGFEDMNIWVKPLRQVWD